MLTLYDYEYFEIVPTRVYATELQIENHFNAMEFSYFFKYYSRYFCVLDIL